MNEGFSHPLSAKGNFDKIDLIKLKQGMRHNTLDFQFKSNTDVKINEKH